MTPTVKDLSAQSTDLNAELLGLDDTKSGEGVLIVNADDWGRDRETTDHTLECVVGGAVSSVSAMVFMEDSTRAVLRLRGNMKSILDYTSTLPRSFLHRATQLN